MAIRDVDIRDSNANCTVFGGKDSKLEVENLSVSNSTV
jgi:hypothetical protein